MFSDNWNIDSDRIYLCTRCSDRLRDLLSYPIWDSFAVECVSLQIDRQSIAPVRKCCSWHNFSFRLTDVPSTHFLPFNVIEWKGKKVSAIKVAIFALANENPSIKRNKANNRKSLSTNFWAIMSTGLKSDDRKKKGLTAQVNVVSMHYFRHH